MTETTTAAQVSQLVSETRALHEQITTTNDNITTAKETLETAVANATTSLQGQFDTLQSDTQSSIASLQQEAISITTEYQVADTAINQAYQQADQQQQNIINQLQQDLTDALNRVQALENTEPPRVYEEYDTAKRSFGSGWANGKTWTERSFRGGSNVSLFLSIPCRNDSTSWGGLYTEVQYSLNNGSWVSLGHSGHDGVMGNKASLILTYTKQFLVLDGDQIPSNDYTLRIRFRHRSYDGTSYVNQLHNSSNSRFGTVLRLTELL